MLMSMMILITFISIVSAADKSYFFSFVAGSQGLGLGNIRQTENGIEVGRTSITPMNKTLGSTAIVSSFFGGWDGDLYYDVLVIIGDHAQQPLTIEGFQIGSQGAYAYHVRTLPQKPGQYHPLHTFHNETAPGILSAGTFGTSGANNYITYRMNRKATERIFVNPENRSPGSAAISPDGRMVSQMTYNGLNHIGLVGRLINGKLSGSPLKWLNVNGYQGYSQSLSNPINSTHRYLAYRNFQDPGTTKSKSQVIIQNVDALTARPTGSARPITDLAKAMDVDAEKMQSTAISQDGELILYTAWDNNCKKEILLARRLVDGSSVGKPKVVFGCRQLEGYERGVYGINVAPGLSTTR
jgi:hypothetical protein